MGLSNEEKVSRIDQYHSFTLSGEIAQTCPEGDAISSELMGISLVWKAGVSPEIFSGMSFRRSSKDVVRKSGVVRDWRRGYKSGRLI